MHQHSNSSSDKKEPDNDNKAYHPGGHYWDYSLGAISLSQVTTDNGFED